MMPAWLGFSLFVLGVFLGGLATGALIVAWYMPRQHPSPRRPAFRTLCAVCKEPQFWTPSGICCTNGHGGADSLLTEDVDLDCGSDHLAELLRRR